MGVTEPSTGGAHPHVVAGPSEVDAGRGWIVVAGSFGITLVGFGSAYAFSAFVGPLQSAFDASRGSVSLVFSLAGFLYFSLGLVSGPLADRWGARRVAVAGMMLVGAGLVLAGLAPTLLWVQISYGLGVGLGIGLSYVPALGAVQRRFDKKRGLASGLAVSGIGIGTLLMPPIASHLIDSIGWRHAYIALGASALLLGLVAASLLDGASLVAPDRTTSRRAGEGSGRIPPNTSTTLADAVRSRAFVLLYAACLVCSFGVFVPFVHLVPYAVEHGISSETAALLVGTIGVGSTIGRFGLGGVADRLGRSRSLVIMFVGMATMLGIWSLATSVATLAGFALLFGVFYGGWVAILPAVVADHFGGRSVSSIIGALYTSVAIGTLIGPSAAGYVFDATHSYRLAILLSAAGTAAAAVIALLVPNARDTVQPR